MKIEIYKNYYLGCYQIIYKKDFDLPFAPFYGLQIIDKNKEYEKVIKFINDDYLNTEIGFDTVEQHFYVCIDTKLHKNTDPNEIDYIIESFNALGWNREDYTNIETLKEIFKYKINKTFKS